MRALESAERTVHDIIRTVDDASAKLRRNWKSIIGRDVSGIHFPVSCTVAINGRHWPSAEVLAQALSAWHTAHHAAGNAYRQIPDDQRQVVQPPPDD